MDPRRRHGLRGALRNVAEAAIFNAANPFAQIQRFIPNAEWERDPTRPPPSQTNMVRSQSNLRGRPQASSMAHRIPDDDSDETMAEAVQVAQAFGPARDLPAGGSGAKKGATETPVSIQRSHFGLPETVTQVLTGTNYFAVTCPANFQSMMRVPFRLTSIVDRMPNQPAAAVGGAAYVASSLYNSIMPPQNTFAFPATPLLFPSDTTDGLQWLDWYTSFYQYYHVMGVEWELTMFNPQLNAQYGVVVATTIDTYSSANATNVHPSGATMEEMEQWPDVRWHQVVPYYSTQDAATRTIKGYYRPGKVRQNVENDEDLKTWTKVNASPSLTELLYVHFGKSMFNPSSSIHGLNCRMKWRYIVQFKDLNVPFRWPALGQTPISPTAPGDITAA